jgi:hypothetical protein
MKVEIERLHARLQTLREAYERSLEAIREQTTVRLIAEEVITFIFMISHSWNSRYRYRYVGVRLCNRCLASATEEAN